MGKRIAYLRVSTAEQNTDRQKEEFKKMGLLIDDYIIDKNSGGNINENLKNLLSILQAGDELIVLSLDRLGRSLKNNLAIIEDLKGRGVNFKSVKEHLVINSTDNPFNELIFNIFSSLAQFGKSTINQNVREGMNTPATKIKLANRPNSKAKIKRLSNEKYLYDLLHAETNQEIKTVAETYKTSLRTGQRDRAYIRIEKRGTDEYIR